jgi:hypothetical protein
MRGAGQHKAPPQGHELLIKELQRFGEDILPHRHLAKVMQECRIPQLTQILGREPCTGPLATFEPFDAARQ